MKQASLVCQVKRGMHDGDMRIGRQQSPNAERHKSWYEAILCFNEAVRRRI
jgi:hypothetical protein